MTAGKTMSDQLAQLGDSLNELDRQETDLDAEYWRKKDSIAEARIEIGGQLEEIARQHAATLDGNNAARRGSSVPSRGERLLSFLRANPKSSLDSLALELYGNSTAISRGKLSSLLHYYRQRGLLRNVSDGQWIVVDSH